MPVNICFGLRYILVPAMPIMIGFLALVAFTSLPGAIVFLACFGLFVYHGLRYWEKHHAGEKFDSKLTDQRMKEARDWWIKEVTND